MRYQRSPPAGAYRLSIMAWAEARSSPGYLLGSMVSCSASQCSTALRRYTTLRPTRKLRGPVPMWRQYRTVEVGARVIAATSAVVSSSSLAGVGFLVSAVGAVVLVVIGVIARPSGTVGLRHRG